MKTRAYCGSFVIRTAWLALAGISGCTAQTVPADWKTDCVGRMQISLPGEADIAAMLPKDLIGRWNGKGDFPEWHLLKRFEFNVSCFKTIDYRT